MGSIDVTYYDALTFDCYGTLIDWETGILSALKRVLAAHRIERDDEELLEGYARHEAALEAGPYLIYRDVLAGSLRKLGEELGFTPSDEELRAFSGSVVDWPAFDDSANALQELKKRFQLGVITNCDDDLFAASNRQLGVVPTDVVDRSESPPLRSGRLGLARHAVAEVDDFRAEGAGLDEFESHPALALGKERNATANQHRVDPGPVLVDQTQRSRLCGESRATDRDVALLRLGSEPLDLFRQAAGRQAGIALHRRQRGGKHHLWKRLPDRGPLEH